MNETHGEGTDDVSQLSSLLVIGCIVSAITYMNVRLRQATIKLEAKRYLLKSQVDL